MCPCSFHLSHFSEAVVFYPDCFISTVLVIVLSRLFHYHLKTFLVIVLSRLFHYYLNTFLVIVLYRLFHYYLNTRQTDDRQTDRQTDTNLSRSDPPSNAPRDEIGRGSPPTPMTINK